MQEHNFDEILDFLCSGIMSKKERQNVRDELFDHLMCKYETNLAIGMEEEKAVESAINDLGDKTVIKYRLSQVHSYYPNLSMKKAMNLLIFGFCLISFQINIFPYMGEITKYIGQVVFLVALFCLSKANVKLKKALTFGFVEFVLTEIAFAITPALPSEIFWIPHLLYIVSCVANVVKWCCLLYGLRDLTAPFKEEYKKNIPYGFTVFSNVLAPIYLIWLYCAMIVSENTDFGSADEAAFIIIPLALISIIMNLVSFVMSSKCLWQNDHEYQIETSSKKKALAAVLALLVTILPILAVDLGVSLEKAETEVYSIDDSNISEAEYDRICNNILSYGVPEKIVYSLPESEIEKFKNSVPATEFENPDYYPLVNQSVDLGRNGFEFAAYNCAIGLRNENGIVDSRFMVWIEYEENIKGHYSDYIQFIPPTGEFLPCYGTDEYSDTVLILSEENGKMLKNEPLEIFYDDFFDGYVSGIKVQAKDGMLIYLGQNYLLDNSQMTAHQMINVYHKVFPITTMRDIPDINDYQNDALGILPFRVHARYWVDFYGNWFEQVESAGDYETVDFK